MPENDKVELELESNLKVNSGSSSIGSHEEHNSPTLDIDDRYVRQIAREDDDHPSLSIYVIPFLIVGLLGIIWFVIAAESVGKWLEKVF